MRQIDKIRLIRGWLNRMKASLPRYTEYTRRRVCGSVRYEAPALLPEQTVDGINLTELMVPHTRGTAEQAAELFSRLVFARLAPDLLEGKTEWRPFGQIARKFAEGNLARTILWLSRRPNCTLEQGEATLMVHGELELGVRDGSVVCLYDSFLPTRALTLERLDQPASLISRDLAFNAIYGRIDPDLRPVLGAAKVGYPNGFESLAPWLITAPTRSTLVEKVTDVLLEGQNPFFTLYTLLVPGLLTRQTFYRNFGRPEIWKPDPSALMRERAYLKLVDLGLI